MCLLPPPILGTYQRLSSHRLTILIIPAAFVLESERARLMDANYGEAGLKPASH